MNGLIPFESTIEQTTETLTLPPKAITAADNKKKRAVVLLCYLLPTRLRKINVVWEN